jgi:DNA-directed RNA polymerase specialized sigma24 family protein
VLEDHEYRACRWYRTRWERSGLDPLSASTIAPNFGVGERAYGHMAKTEAQAQARSDYRWAREQIPVDVRKLFDAVVIDDLSIDDAARIVRLRYRNAQAGFRRAVLVLFDAVKDDLRLDLPIAP